MPITSEREELLFKVGPGTPSGEVLRRYWLPVETSGNFASTGRAGAVSASSFLSYRSGFWLRRSAKPVPAEAPKKIVPSTAATCGRHRFR